MPAGQRACSARRSRTSSRSIQPGSSDSAALDAVFELMVRAGRDLPMAKTMLIPEAWSQNRPCPRRARTSTATATRSWSLGRAGRDLRLRRPLGWSPAWTATAAAHALHHHRRRPAVRRLGDRHGAPRRGQIVEKGRIGPGQMLAVDLIEGRSTTTRRSRTTWPPSGPSASWVANITVIDDLIRRTTASPPSSNGGAAPPPARLRADHGGPGADPPSHGRGRQGGGRLHGRRHAAGRAVRTSYAGPAPLLPAELQPGHQSADRFLARAAGHDAEDPARQPGQHPGRGRSPSAGCCSSTRRSCPTPSSRPCAPTWARPRSTSTAPSIAGRRRGRAAQRARAIRREAEDAVRGGCEHVVLSDKAVSAAAPIPMILATGGGHSHLMRQKLRTFTSLNVRSGECLDVHYFAVLIGCRRDHGQRLSGPGIDRRPPPPRPVRRHEPGGGCVTRYKKAVDDGLLKIMSKMGISVISSYRGGYNFEAVGLSRTLVDEFFPGMPSRLSGIGLTGIQQKVLELHEPRLERGPRGPAGRRLLPLPPRRRAARLGRQPDPHAAGRGRSDSYSTYKKFSDGVAKLPPSRCATCWISRPRGPRPVPLEEVESITSIRKRFVTPGMSLGALSPEAHGTLNIAMNRSAPSRIPARAARTRSATRPDPTATTRTRRSSRSPRAASA